MGYVVRARQLSSLCGARGIQVCPVRRNGKRKSGDRRDDSGDLPSSQNDSTDPRAEHTVTTTEGKLVGEALLKVELAIKVQRGVVSTEVGIEEKVGAIITDNVAQR